ncbi:MAG TPA: hypothetical protein VGH04_15545, partial [Gemmatimonadaceae bacterium]
RYAVATTTLLGLLSVAAFSHGSQHAKFDVIDVERINVVEPNGNYRMVISNRPRSIGPIYKGKPFGYEGGGRPGIIFFNDEGTENGGWTFTGSACTNGKLAEGRNCKPGDYRASTHMSFDQFNSDQVLNLDYQEQNGQRVTGISVNDRAVFDIYDMVMQRDSIQKIADTVARKAAMAQLVAPRNGVPLVAQRMFIGKDPSKAAVLNLSDPNGKPRLRLVVDSLGAARIEFLDAAGHVTNTVDGRK